MKSLFYILTSLLIGAMFFVYLSMNREDTRHLESSITTSIVSHFGMFGTPRDFISIKKMVGAVFIILGVIFSTI